MSQPSGRFCPSNIDMHDIRDAFRSLVATPVVSAVAILSLALGIGANTAIFSILDSLILRTLPVEEPQRLVLLDRGSWTNPIWEAIRERQQAFNGAMAWSTTRFNLAQGGQTEMVDGIWASGAFFDVLGVPAILGRTFAPEDDRRGGGADGPVAVISYNFWQRRFGGNADVIGKPLLVERVTYTIIGVTPPDFFGDRSRPDVRRGHSARHRTAGARQGKLARPPVELVVEHHAPPACLAKTRLQQRRRSAGCSPRSATSRCLRTGRNSTRRRISRTPLPSFLPRQAAPGCAGVISSRSRQSWSSWCWSCSSRAPTSPTSCSRGPTRGGTSSASVSRSAHRNSASRASY